jgi:ubiquitin carboxyl-terminal hydrolase 25/28
MDNCMFQIETALLDFEGPVNVDAGTTSVVKRYVTYCASPVDFSQLFDSLFYGKMRQRITALEDDPNSSGKKAVNEKDDLFSHLPVNVSEEGFDLYDGLGGYFRDVVEFEGKKATMEVTLIDLPPILQIQLQVNFLRARLQPVKADNFSACAVQPGDTPALQVPVVRQVWRKPVHGSIS